VAGSPLKKLRKKLQDADEFGLDPRDREFVDVWFAFKDVTRALHKAYGPKAGNISSRIFAKPAVQTYIAHLQKEQRQRYPHQHEWVIDQLLYILGFRNKMLTDADGAPLPLHEWPDAVDAAVQSIKRKDYFEGHGEERDLVGEIVEIKTYSKTEAAHMLLRYFGVENGRGGSQGDRLNEVIAAMREGPVERAKK
jgi:phage terminase small subunit